MFCIVWTFRLIVKSISHRSIMFQSLLQICVTLSFRPRIFLVGEAALNISVDHFFRWKGKGSLIVPWSWGTPQWRESSLRIDAWLLTIRLYIRLVWREFIHFRASSALWSIVSKTFFKSIKFAPLRVHSFYIKRIKLWFVILQDRESAVGSEGRCLAYIDEFHLVGNWMTFLEQWSFGKENTLLALFALKNGLVSTLGI